MSFQTHLLHRSLFEEGAGLQNRSLILQAAFSASQLDAISYDAKARFDASPPHFGHTKGVNALAIENAGERWMISGGSDGSTLIWDLDTSEASLSSTAAVSKKDRHSFGISSIKFNPFDSQLFTTGSFDKTLKIFSILPRSDVECIVTYPLEALVYSHSTSPCAVGYPLIACATSSPHIRLLDPRMSSGAQTLFGHATANLSVTWSPVHPPILASGSQDGTIRIWDIRYGAACLGTLDSRGIPSTPNQSPERAHDAGVNGLCWTADGSKLVSAGQDARVKIWDMDDGINTNVIFPPALRNRYQQVLDMHILGYGNGELDSPVLLVASDNAILGFDMQTGQLIKRLKVPRDGRTGPGKVNSLAIRTRNMELYTGHAMTANPANIARASILRWVPQWDEGEDAIEKSKTAEQIALDVIYSQLTKTPIRFG